MTPLPGFVDKFMPKQFVERGYYDTALIGDATEVLISQSENYDLNNLTFSMVTRTIQPERYVYGQCLVGFYSIVLRHILVV